MTALDKAGTGSIEAEDFNAVVDAVAALQTTVAASVAANVVHASATTNSNTSQLNLVIDALIAAGLMEAAA